jgi:hypothetical protein
MFDKFKRATKSIDSVAENAFAVTPSDANDLPSATRSVYVGTGGNLTCTLVGDDTAVTFHNVVGGTILPIRLKKVFANGTTAADIVGLS